MFTPASQEALAGHSILLVEDEPLIVLDVESILQDAGARVLSSHSVDGALPLTDHPSLSAAVLDCQLGDGDIAPVCAKLSKLDVPFVFYTGCNFNAPDFYGAFAPIVHKPAIPEALIGAIKFVITASKRTGGDLPLLKVREEANVTIARRHIQEGEERIERIRRIISRLARGGYDTSSAQELLQIMTATLNNMYEHERIIRSSGSRENQP